MFNDKNGYFNYIPAGSFARAIILGGADANASVNGQTSSSPILLKVITNAVLPNGQNANIKDCFIIASMFGDVSSGRGEVRLTNLSCVREHKTILDIPIQGTVYDSSGKNGLQGHVIMKNGKLLAYAGIAGLLSGIGSTVQQSILSPQLQEVPGMGKIFKYGVSKGGNTALSKLSDYFIKRADQHHPIVEICAGKIIDVMFQKGFYLSGEQNNTNELEKTTDIANYNIPPEYNYGIAQKPATDKL